MSGDAATDRAVELAERILDEVSRLDQDWRTIALWARELTAVADAAAVAARSRPPHRGSEPSN
jgi:hypothetical protein